MLDTKTTAEALKERLERALEVSGLTKAELARQCTEISGEKVTQQSVGSWFKTGRMDKRWLPIVEKITGYPLGFGAVLLPGRAEINLQDNPDYPSVRRVQFKLSAGTAGYAVEYVDDDGPPIVFRRDWFEMHNYKPEKLLAARVFGASMEPTLYETDLVVINTAQVEPKDGRAFALNYEGILSIKRLVRDGGEWRIRSDNPDKIRYPDKSTHDGVSIIGEIVYRQSERI